MAEIRSTLDMVMERAAKMAAESTKEVKDDSLVHEGMRLAADYLKGSEDSLMTILQKQEKEKQKAILEGMTATLLRNIVLPRDEFLLEGSLKSLAAITEIGPDEVLTVCQELHQILNQYSQHKEQSQNQLDDAIRSQLEQKLAEQGTQLTEDMSINPAMHPQYREELERMLTGLNGQYNDALDQRKQLIRQHLATAL